MKIVSVPFYATWYIEDTRYLPGDTMWIKNQLTDRSGNNVQFLQCMSMMSSKFLGILTVFVPRQYVILLSARNY